MKPRYVKISILIFAILAILQIVPFFIWRISNFGLKFEKKQQYSSTIKAAYVSQPPYSYKENNKTTGYNIEVLKELAERLQCNITFEPVPLEKALKGLNCSYDIVAGISSGTPDAENYLFTSPIESDFYVACGKVVNSYRITGWSSKVFAVVKCDPVLSKLNSMGLDNQLVYFETYREALYAVANGLCDMAIVPERTAKSLTNTSALKNIQISNEPVEEVAYSFACSKNNRELAQLLDLALVATDNDGTLGKIFSRWMGKNRHWYSGGSYRVFALFNFWVLLSFSAIAVLIALVVEAAFHRKNQAKIALKNSQIQKIKEENSIALEQMGKAICYFDLALGIFRFPESLAKKLDIKEVLLDAPESIYKLLNPVFDAETQKRFRQFLESIYAGEKTGSGEFFINNNAHLQNVKSIWVHLSFVNIFENSVPVRAIVTIENVTEQHMQSVIYERFKKTTLARAMRQESCYCIIDLTSDKIESLRCYLIEDNFDLSAMHANDLRTLLAPLDLENSSHKKIADMDISKNLLDNFASHKYDYYDIYHGHFPNGEPLWVQMTVQLLQDTFDSHTIAFIEFFDITLQKEKEMSLLNMAEKDSLTGLLNRGAATQHIGRSLDVLTGSAAFALLDMDGLKQINDRWGHDEGDRMIKTFAGCISEHFKEGICGRIGGDEFLVYLPLEANTEPLTNIFDSFIKRLNSNIIGNSSSKRLGGSIGITIAGNTLHDLDALYKQADLALYKAKTTGKNNYYFYNPSLEHNSSEENRQIQALPKSLNERNGSVFVGNELMTEPFMGLQWLIQNRTISCAEELMLESDDDVFIVYNQETYDIVDFKMKNEEKCRKIWGDWHGKKCYQVLHQRNTPCPNCKDPTRCEDYFIEHLQNEITGREYLVKGRRLAKEDGNLEMQVLTDISSRGNLIEKYQQSIEERNLFMRCMSPGFVQTENVTSSSLQKILGLVCDFFDADGGIVFTFEGDMGIVNYVNPKSQNQDKNDVNLIEENIVFQSRDGKMRIPYAILDAINEKITSDSIIYVKNDEEIKQQMPGLYAFYSANKIDSVCILPIMSGDKPLGLVSLKNMKNNLGSLPVLVSLATAIRAQIRRNVLALQNEASAYYDTLTGYLNFEGFKKEAKRILQTAKPNEYLLVYSDTRNFKYINDVFGFDVGDDLLRHAADFISQNMQNGETFCRVSADIFCALKRFSNQQTNQLEFENYEKNLFRFFDRQNEQYMPEVSVGAVLIDDTTMPLEQIINCANVALSISRENQGGSITFFTEEMRRQKDRSLHLETQIEQALQQGEIDVYFQPVAQLLQTEDGLENIGDLKNVLTAKNKAGRVMVEAIASWCRSGEVFSEAKEFIPIFERSGKIVDLDRHIFRNVCRFIKLVRENYGTELQVCVNTSIVSMLKNSFVEDYAAICDQFDVKRDQIIIEFREVLEKDSDKLASVIEALNKCGFLCSLANFGGKCSISASFQCFPLAMFKLDKDLVKNVVNAQNQHTILKNAFEMAKVFAIQTGIKGVDTKEQLSLLSLCKCDCIQGAIFAKSMAQGDFLQWLSVQIN